MSYESLIGRAIHLWPFQDLSGGAVDVVGVSPLAGSGGLVYGAAGPSVWLPRAIRITAIDAILSSPGVAGAVGLVGYTLGMWVRAHDLSSAFFRVITAGGFFPLFVNNSVFITNLPWGVFTSSLNASSGVWDYVTIGRSLDGLSSWVSVNGVRETFVSTALPMVGLPILVGSSVFPPMRSFAQVALWSFPLTLADVDLVVGGPLSRAPRVRGSSRGRRIGNVR